MLNTAGMHVYKHKRPGAKYRCLFMIDEFPAPGKIGDMPRDIATMNRRG